MMMVVKMKIQYIYVFVAADHPADDHLADDHHVRHADVQGVCGEQAGSAVVCGPTQVKNKKVKMMFKASYIIIFDHHIFSCLSLS